MISESRSNNTSLAIFKPTEIKDFVVEPVERTWDSKKLKNLQSLSQQLNLFQTAEEIEAEFKVVPKMPYRFSYKFVDDSGKQSTMMIEDWEIGMLFFNCLKRAKNNERDAIAKVKEKYLDSFIKKDLHFFLGTTLRFHNVAPNPFIIIGVFYPPMPDPNQQISLLD